MLPTRYFVEERERERELPGCWYFFNRQREKYPNKRTWRLVAEKTAGSAHSLNSLMIET